MFSAAPLVVIDVPVPITCSCSVCQVSQSVFTSQPAEVAGAKSEAWAGAK